MRGDDGTRRRAVSRTPEPPGAAHPRMTPRERYHDELSRGVLLPDPAQAALVEELDRIHRSLIAAPDGGMLTRLVGRLGRREPARGLYVWGGVGRGKTRLVDLFASALDSKLYCYGKVSSDPVLCRRGKEGGKQKGKE